MATIRSALCAAARRTMGPALAATCPQHPDTKATKDRIALRTVIATLQKDLDNPPNLTALLVKLGKVKPLNPADFPRFLEVSVASSAGSKDAISAELLAMIQIPPNTNL